MDASFTFPRPQAPVPRPAPAVGQQPTRESNALRASVLDAALELGLVGNSLVADWMFDSSLPEEDEEEDPVSSPGLTYGSSAASLESYSSALTPASSINSLAPSRYPDAFGAGAQFPLDNLELNARKDGDTRIIEPEIRGRSQDTGFSIVSFPEPPTPMRPATPGGTRKLKKKFRAEGYESDGGYMSESGKKKEKKAKKEKKKDGETTLPVESEKDAKKRAAKEEKKEQEEERKRKKSILSAEKASKKAEKKEAAEQANGGYDTDVTGKSLTKSKTRKSKSKTAPSEGVGYETDGAGYQSTASVGAKKTKSRFFNKLSGKSSRTDLRAEVEPVPALPPSLEIEAVSLPIAERFATSLSPTASSRISPSDSRPTPPVVLELPPPLPPLSFQSFSPSSSSEPPPSSARALAAATAPSPFNRTSHSSTESSSSSGSKPHGAQFSPNRDTDSVHSGSVHGHGNGSGSRSTITSSSHQHSFQHMPNHNPVVSLNTPSSLTHSDHPGSGSGSLKPPAFSYPTTRTPSPSAMTTPLVIPPTTSYPPVSPLQITKGLRMRPSWENPMVSSKNGGSSPSPALPFIMTPPLRSTSSSSSPVLAHPSPHFPPSANQIGGYLPRSRRNSTNPSPHPVISPPNTAIKGPSTHLTTMPSSDYHIPSPRHSNLPPPSTLAYYDIPPPSPPPMGPLPSVPTGRPGNSSGNANVLPSPAALRQRLIDRTPRQLPPDHLHPVVHPPSNLQRGRESPFPSRPLLQPPGSAPATIGGSSPGLGPVRRNGSVPPSSGPLAGGGGGGSAPADAYANSRYQEEKDRAYARRAAGGPALRQPTRSNRVDDDIEEVGSVNDHENGRFDSAESADSHHGDPGRALGHSYSTEVMKDKRHESFAVSEYYGARTRVPRSSSSNGHDGRARESEYQFDDGHTVGDRTSRWSGSVYSLESILGEDESGETRDRLVRRVEEMLNSEAKGTVNGDAGRGYVPPVPRLPDAYVNANTGAMPRVHDIQPEATPGRSWNKF